MRKEKEISIEIGPDGTIKIDAAGFEGKGCHEAIEAYRAVLGKVQQQQRKKEFYQNKVPVNKQNKIRG